LIYDKGHENDLEVAQNTLNSIAKKLEASEQGHSEIDEINDKAGVSPVKVSKETFEFMEYSVKYAKETKGLFNPAIGAINKLWRIGFPDAEVPKDEFIKQALDKVDYKDIELNKENQTVFLKKKGMLVIPGAIGKAFLGVHILDDLKAKGVTTAVVNLGGHAYTMGKNPKYKSGAWRVAIANPELGDSAQTGELGILTSKHISFNTSNYYGRYLKYGDQVYSHLLDSKTGYPIDNDLLSVTIVGDNPVWDDALSNSVFSMGLKEGMKYINNHSEVDAVFVTKDKKVYVSKHIPGEFVLTNTTFTLGKDIN
jgi:thiamine biosynthesis lipoprotein